MFQYLHFWYFPRLEKNFQNRFSVQQSEEFDIDSLNRSLLKVVIGNIQPMMYSNDMSVRNIHMWVEEHSFR